MPFRELHNLWQDPQSTGLLITRQKKKEKEKATKQSKKTHRKQNPGRSTQKRHRECLYQCWSNSLSTLMQEGSTGWRVSRSKNPKVRLQTAQIKFPKQINSSGQTVFKQWQIGCLEIERSVSCYTYSMHFCLEPVFDRFMTKIFAYKLVRETDEGKHRKAN